MMTYFIAICGVLGAWLLFAGPLLQGTLELKEQEFDRDKFDEVVSSVPAAEQVSNWWWLLPPVAYYRNRNRAMVQREAIMRALPAQQREQALVFLNKATGWFIVAGGAALFLVKETWELVEAFEWPLWLFWVLVAVGLLQGLINATVRMQRTSKVLGTGEDEPTENPAAGEA